jgi:hypothetical protein
MQNIKEIKMELICLRLNSGEEVIGQLNLCGEDGIDVSKARQLQVMDMGNGQAGAAFVPVLLLANDNEPIFIPHTGYVAFTKKVNAEYERRYLEAVSGIQLAASLKG